MRRLYATAISRPLPRCIPNVTVDAHLDPWAVREGSRGGNTGSSAPKHAPRSVLAMTLVETARNEQVETSTWERACPVDELEPQWGEAILIRMRQIALFLIGPDEIYAVDHIDPETRAAVIARGIVGSRGDRPTVASPLHKQVYDLGTGECFGHPELVLGVYRTRVVGGFIEVEVPG